MLESLRGESYLYNLLRQLYLAEPTKEVVADMARIDAPQGTDPVTQGIRLLSEAAKKNGEELDWLDCLAVEYAGLFLGPVKPRAIPYASFYLSESRELMTDETIEVRKRYLEGGMALKDLYRFPDDHIGVELEFLFHLTGEIIDRLEQSKPDEATNLLAMRNAFIQEHMARWVPSFTENIIESTNEDFYRGAASLLRGMVEMPAAEA